MKKKLTSAEPGNKAADRGPGAGATLRERDETYRLLAENIPGIVYRVFVRDKWRMQFFNSMLFTLTGYTPEELTHGKVCSIDPLIHPADRPKVVATIKAAIRRNGPFDVEYRLTAKHGALRYFVERGRAIPGEDGQCNYIDGIIFDITERHQMVMALDQEKKFAESMFNTAQVIMLVLDTQAGIVTFNPFMEALSGYKLAEVKGKDWFDTFLPKADHTRIREVFKQAIKNSHTRGNINPIITKDGRKVLIEWYDKTLKDYDGRTIGIIAVGHDITEHKQAEDRINALLCEKELLLKEVHHRIKNHMNIMLSLLSMQSSAHALKEPTASALLQDARNRLLGMGVLYNKLYCSEQVGKLSVKTYLLPLINEIVGTFPHCASVKIKTQIDDFVLDAAILMSLGLIINELLTNAMKHAFSGRDDGVIMVSATIKNCHATIIIEDNGNGIPETVDLEKANSFGFLLINGLTQQLRGSIKMERRPGARFVLSFAV